MRSNKSPRSQSEKRYKAVSIVLLIYSIVSFLAFAFPAFDTAISTGIVSTVFCIVCLIVSIIFWKKHKLLQANTEKQLPQNKSIFPESSTETAPPRMEDNKSISEAHILKTETLHITGTSHYMDNILDLAIENYLYDYSKKELIEDGLEDERIYQYEFYPSKVELVAEPENQYDSNAIRVLIDDIHVGYVKSGSCTHVKKLLNSGRVTAIDAEIYGGTYKLLWEDENGEYQIERNNTPIKINVKITTR